MSVFHPIVTSSACSCQSSRREWLRAAKTVLLYALLYAVADFALNRFAFSDGWTILWPLNGATIALLLMRPRSAWAPLLCGVALGTGIGERSDHNTLSLVLWQRAISLVEVILTASLLPAFATLPEWLRTPRIFPRLLTALLVGPGFSGILAAIYFHLAKHQAYLGAFNDWATADALGIAATLPLALSLRSPELRSLLRREALPRTVGVLSLAIVAAALALSVSGYPLLFLLYPMLLLVDSLLAFAGSAMAMFVVCFIAVYLATTHHGPFGVWPQELPVPRDVALQLYLGFHILALFPASILIGERKRIAEDLQDANVQLTMLASLDGLTGIANRRALDGRFAEEWHRAHRAASPLALLMIDIDHFKEFNDCYGHHQGDQALVSVATALAETMRRPGDLVARFGGEEFAVLLPHTDLAGASHLAEMLRSVVEDLAIAHAGSEWGRVTISVGCAANTPPASVVEADRLELLTAADQALYQAKQGGRNCVAIEGRVPEAVLQPAGGG